ncbi:hypothetical protein Cch01nite_04460 [Cellulomonas chitinilytica]|uniref:Uncharacterized protein n=1 Tax=Cellulomonas chitinilytica TaxID=398759 RepID=A0A919NY91_9CELL|nr:hypothetical protein [Cellulomonas chitinilytica]GIG19722.1 hypothetical protein Cch01nite_04460 [Cellulomonas chitinilytica]
MTRDREAAPTETTAELVRAVRLAEGAFGAADLEVTGHVLVAARRLSGGSPQCSGVRCWELVFKPERLVPNSPDELVGAGGEIRFTADLDAGEAVFTGFGD